MGAFEDGLGADLGAPQGGRRVGREVRVAGAAGEDHDPALLEVPHGPTADVRLGNLGHLDGGHDAGRLGHLLEGVLQRQGVDDGGEHPHVVGVGPVHAFARSRVPPPDVAAPDHDGDLGAQLEAGLGHLGSHAGHDRPVDPVAEGAVGERLPRKLQDDPLPAGRAPARRQITGHVISARLPLGRSD